MVTADLDPYVATAYFVVESALCIVDLIKEGSPHRSGVLTPSVAFGQRLFERLQRAGIHIDGEIKAPKSGL
jgi:short subunit dehydrogenase-like uncharacterized protein